MASIQKRGKKYAVVYSYEDTDGTKRQKWESYSTKKRQQNEKQLLKMKLTMALSSRPAAPQSECSL